jgi:hypothetical protein
LPAGALPLSLCLLLLLQSVLLLQQLRDREDAASCVVILIHRCLIGPAVPTA